MPTISVIVPIFNTGKYLRRCVDSILAQSIEDIEVILVDDGSTDSSAAICDEYKSKNCNIVVIHQANAGVSCARNTGLSVSTGEYIHFADSDDFLGRGFYNNIVNQMITNGADIGCCSSLVQNNKGDFVAKFDNDDFEVLSTEQAVASLLKSDKISYSLCDKLFNRKIIDGIWFRSGIYHNEDFLFCYEALKRANRITVTTHPYYHYCFNLGSAVNSTFNDRKATAIYAQSIVNKDIHKQFTSLVELADTQYYKVLIYLASQMIRSGYNNASVLSDVKNLIRNNIIRILQSDLANGYKKNALALSLGWSIFKFISR